MRFSPKKIAATAVGVATLGLGVGAYAYFTQPGAGSGSAAVGTSSAISLSATTSSTLYPNGSSDVAITVTNPGHGNQYVGSVHLASVDVSSGHASCSASDFTMPDVAVSQDLAAGGSATVHGTLSMANSGNQDACQGASLTLNLSSN
jgi:hypothetical protein